MIDYKKLKLAHVLAEKLSIIDKYPVYISTRLFHEFSMYRLQSRDTEGNDESHFEGIDGLITKLKELTQPKSKYQIGQKVWGLAYNQTMPCEVTITEIDHNSDEKYTCTEYDMWWCEQDLYVSKTQLIEAQLKYWSNLYEEANPNVLILVKRKDCEHLWVRGKCHYCEGDKECQHESDGRYYNKNGLNFEYEKCIKCGGFYK